MDKNFTDRELFRDGIIELLEDVSNDNIVYILNGRTGFGKSAFGQHIIDLFKGTYLGIKVRILSGDKISLDEGFYFRNIAQNVSEKSSTYGYPSISEFLKDTPDSVIQKIYAKQFADDLSEAFPVSKVLTRLYEKDASPHYLSGYEHLFPEDPRYIYIILEKYLAECFKYQRRVILNIENIQNIDKLSLLKLKELLKNSDNLFLLLEYTSPDDSIVSAKKFEENFIDVPAKVITKNLKKLDYKNTCELLEKMYPEKAELKDEQIKKDIFITIDGNLRQLSDIESIYELSDDQPEKISQKQDYTLDRLGNLTDSNQAMLLCLVIAHMGEVELSVLKDLIRHMNYLLLINFDDTLCALSGKNGLLDKNQYKIRVSHDSIAQQSMNIPLLKNKIILGYTSWIKYYEDRLDSCENDGIFYENEIVKKLCYFYIKYPPLGRGIIRLFPQIRKIVLNSCNPEEAVSFLAVLHDNIKYCEDEKLSDDIQYFLLKLYYETGLYENAYELSKHIKFPAEEVCILYRAILQNRLKNYKEAMELCKNAAETTDNEHFALCAKLIRFISAASENDHILCKEIFDDCIHNKNYTQYYEYGFLLRNSTIVLPLQESLPFLEKSAAHFKRFHAPLAEAHTRVSLLMNYSRIGYFGNAAKNLVIAKRLLYKESLERYVLLNDETAFKMCMGFFNPEFEDDLKLAMCTATTVFPKLVINKNLLILYAKNQQWSKGHELVEVLLKLINEEKNRLNICFTYWDISYFYKQLGDMRAETYYREYQRMYKELKKNNKKLEQKNVFHKPNHEFVIEFLSYWHFPIPDTL